MLDPSTHSTYAAAWRSLCAIVLASSAWACEPQAPDPSLALERAEPYVDAFAEFDRWSRRAPVADVAMPGPAALSEALFAPLRLDSRVRGAWVRLGKGGPNRLAHPPGAQAPDDLRWVAVRHARLGELRVALTSRCPGRGDMAGGDAGCVWLSRSTRHRPSRELTVIVAYRDPDAVAAR